MSSHLRSAATACTRVQVLVPVGVYVAFTLLATWSAQPSSGEPLDLHYLREGASALTSAHLHLYARHPQIQVGPLALALVALGRSLGGGLVLAQLAAALLGCLGFGALLYCAHLPAGVLPAGVPHPPRQGAGAGGVPALHSRAHQDLVSARLRTLTCAAPVLALSWGEVFVRWGHLEDCLAIALLLGVLVGVYSRRPLLAGALLGLSVAAKPWTLGCVLLLALLPDWGGRLRACAVATALVLGAYLPFLLGDLHTFAALAHFHIAPQRDSLPALLGRSQALPGERLIQGGLALVGGCLALRWRPGGVFAVVVLARMIPDAGTFEYYTAGLVCALVVFALSRVESLPSRPEGLARVRLAPWAGTAWLAWVLLDLDPFLLPFSLPLSRLIILVLLALSLALPHRPAGSQQGRRDGTSGHDEREVS